MKRWIAAFMMIILALSLSACERPEAKNVYTVGIGNVQYTVDTQNMTISDGMYTYGVQMGNNTVTITYPNGATFYWTQKGNMGHGGWSDNYDENTYADGHILLQALEQSPGSRETRERSGNPLLGLVFLLLGLWNAIAPYSGWYLRHGWRYKDAEPSDVSLGLTRFGGVVGILVGLGLMFL